MILFLTTMVAMAKPDALVTHLESRSYRLNGKMLVVSKDKVLLGKIDSSQLQTETLPKMGDLDKEITRLQNKYGVTCVINIEPVIETNTPQENTDGAQKTQIISGVSITDLGTCTEDSSVRYSIKDNGSLWTVVDSQGIPVSVQAFANVCEDIPLLLKLDLEESVANRNGQALQWGATALGVGGLFTMGNPDPGFSAREQNKFWTGVFLFGSAAILYTQRDMPFVYKTEHQTKLSNYHTREEVDRILLKTFGAENPQEDPTGDGRDATKEMATESKPADTERQVEESQDIQNNQSIETTEDKTSDDSSAPVTLPSEENALSNEPSIVEPKSSPDTSTTNTKKETPDSSDDSDKTKDQPSEEQPSKDQPAEVQP